ncbi:MAG: protein-methionine-sulfoxide reductase heme-binding subunit MsrQ [Bryobacteraceae bacterium]
MGKKFFFSPWTKRALFLLCLIPGSLLVWRGFAGRLTANPVEYLEHTTGDWALRFLLITLAVTPLRKLFNQPLLTRFRRMLGLFAFFYAFSHLMLYLIFDQLFDVAGIWADVVKRPYITVGTAGLVMMIPLAITSTAGMVRRMGAKYWQRLHRLIYFSTLAGIIHYYWLVKSDVREPFMYFGILSVLMLFRVRMWLTKDKKPTPTPISAGA